MKFENNWDISPWPYNMYEPVLKLHMRDMARMEKGSPDDDSSFMIKYDPSIIAGRYSRPPTAKEIAMRKLSGRPSKTAAQIEEAVHAPTAYDSPEEKNILGGFGLGHAFSASKTAIGSIMRVKAYGRSGNQESQPNQLLETYGYTIRLLKDKNTPIISEHPEDFLLYAYRNYIRMPSIVRGFGWESRHQHVRRVEICLHAVVLTQVFKLHLEDYLEVEPHWHCIASTEVSA